jgi:hypothetical protein
MWISCPGFIVEVPWFAFVGSLLWRQIVVCYLELAKNALFAQKSVYLFYVQSFLSWHCACAVFAFIVVKGLVHQAWLFLWERNCAVKRFLKLFLSLPGPFASSRKFSRYNTFSQGQREWSDRWLLFCLVTKPYSTWRMLLVDRWRHFMALIYC